MKTTDRKTPAQRPTASADRPGDAASRPEGPAFAPRPAPVADDRSGLFTGGETLH